VVSRCSAAPSGEKSDSSASAQQESAQVENQVNADIPEELRWRDTDFAVDPTRTTWNNKDNGRKVVYLTIDDGPSNLTEQYLDLFDKYNCKVTFFVTGHDPNYYHLIHEAYKRGHTIGLHTMSHEYDKIYASEEAYFSDLDQIGQVVKDQIGYVPCFIRFPGGSSNAISANYTRGIMSTLSDAVQARGYQYYDWDASCGDGSVHTADETEYFATEGCGAVGMQNVIMLLHDSAAKDTTVAALPKIIEYWRAQGYEFAAIDRDTRYAHHGIGN
jgi:peptidoglycan/xylan/chitin deacetylase (PgdA/CDA1 family)